MPNGTWEINPDWRDLQDPAAGDIIHLKYTHEVSYLVQAVVKSATNKGVTAIIETVYGWNDRAVVVNGPALKLINTELTFYKGLLQNVISNLDQFWEDGPEDLEG